MRLTALIGAMAMLLSCGTAVAAAPERRDTPYAKDAMYFEAAALELADAPAPQLGSVFGGVVTHHIPNAAKLITDFYLRLAALGRIDTVVILGPDHFERGSAPITVANARFVTPFGVLEPAAELIDIIGRSGLATLDNAAFDDHAVHSQLLAIARVFPRARVVPVLFRSKGDNRTAAQLGKLIAQSAGPRTVVVGSVDFSHYLTTQQATPLDVHAARTLAMLKPELAGVAEADSPQALTALIAAVQSMGATSTQTLGIHNSDEFSSRRSDVTTGYVIQYYGTPRDYGAFAGAIDRMRYDGVNLQP